MLKGLQNIHFIGIGGAGMSAIAHVLLKRGYQVSGSDLNAGHMGAKLAQEGALVYMGHAECQIDDVDAVVISSAIHQNNPELMEAKNVIYLFCTDQMCWQRFLIMLMGWLWQVLTAKLLPVQ